MMKCDFCVKSNDKGKCTHSYMDAFSREFYCAEAINKMMVFYSTNQINNFQPPTGGSVVQDD